MARKEKQQKNGLDQRPRNRKAEVSDPATSPLATKDGGNTNNEEMKLGKELPNGTHSEHFTKNTNDVDSAQDGKNSKKKSRKSQSKDRKSADETVTGPAVSSNDNIEVEKSGASTAEASNVGDGSDMPHNDFNNVNGVDDSVGGLGREEGLGNVEYPETAVFKFIRTAALSVARSSASWVERHKPTFAVLKSDILNGCDHVRTKIQHSKPIIFRWIRHIGNIMLLLFMVWLDCTVRGMDSFLRMGTTSFFLILWCSVLSVIAMAGLGKFLLTLVVTAAVGLFLGFTLAIVMSGLIIFLWFYGSFWTTGLIIFLGGLAFMTTHDRLALFITSVYSMYCAWNYVGWLGLVLGLNLSFISSDALLFLLRNIINEQGTAHSNPEQTTGFQGQTPFHPNESLPTDNGSGGHRADRSPGMPSTSGSDSEMTSEDEVVRLLNCADHYAALGLSRFENIDASVIKREYRKKAMLVHPDKNMGDEKAVEAFKKLQNAYEVLLDSFKRKEYDDELRRQELLNYFRKFQNTSPQNQGHGSFKSRFGRPENGDDPLRESRQIACRKCGHFHNWVFTNKLKVKARWCQECKDFHQAKDGDGWVEQSSQPFFFGMLQQVESPSAYVCAGGKVYDATEWYICQGMRCPVNTHKPSFHVNTSVVSKNAQAKGTVPGQRGGMPAPNMEETMSEEEFLEWLQNAMQSGMFENFGGTTSESPSGSNSKSDSSGGGTNSSSKRKKKGKKAW
ncbi:uncharacterized protein LOC121799777 [Salvia splendens]|uniref:uncharacterized protein LOC121799777 n=1 Tax=Salvia splendens TaxID=180675 RepID=UPI0011017EBD|nr:uncharacterized protein LOC121799777 [Salvia splendens]